MGSNPKTTGKEHSLGCSAEDCPAWVKVWLPTRTPAAFIEKTFFCGFCAAKKIALLEQELKGLRVAQESTKADVGELKAQIPEQPVFPTASYAEVVSKGINVATLSREIRNEEHEQASRANNIIISGSKPNNNEEEEKEFVRALADEVDVSLDGVNIHVQRIGAVNGNGKQLLRVKLSADKRKDLLKKARELADGRFKDIYIQPDRTVAEQKADFELRKHLRQVREEHPESRWVIRRGKVIKATPAPENFE